MNFFEQLAQVLAEIPKIQFTATLKNGELTIGFFPEFNSKAINTKTNPITLTGTPQELEDGFFTEIRKPLETIAGLKSNADAIAKEAGEAAKKEIEDKAKAKVNAKPAAKKAAPKKAAAPPKKNVPAKKAAAPAAKKSASAPKKTTPVKPPVKKAAAVKENKVDELSSADEILKAQQINKAQENETYEKEINEALNEKVPEVEIFPENENTTEEIKTPEVLKETPNPTPEPEASDDQNKFDLEMQQGNEYMTAKEYVRAQVRFQNAIVIATKQGNQKNRKTALDEEKKAAQWVRAQARLHT